MKVPNIRGPRLATKLFFLMSLALVVIPWFSYRYLKEMEGFLVDSQANAQLLTAEGISTLLNGRPDLFYELPLSPDGYEQLYAHPLTTPIRIDGKSNDWEEVLNYNVSFGRAEPDEPNENGEGAPNQFYLVLGEHNDQVYALVQVKDDKLVFRDRNILRLDLSDHIRITFTGQSGEIRKLVITMTEPGVTTAYAMDNDWRYAIQGVAENRVQGFMTATPDGYAVEFRVPLELLGSTKHFGLAVVDVDSAETRAIQSITGTLPSAGREAFGLVLLKSPEVLRIIEGLGYSGANIQVIDAQRRVRAEVGSYSAQSAQTPKPPPRAWYLAGPTVISQVLDQLYSTIEVGLRDATPIPEDNVIFAALNGHANYQRRYTSEEGETITAAYPIVAQAKVIGTVVLKQNTNRILELRRDGLERIINFSVLSLFIFAALILAFSVHLTRRIRKLGAEATNAIDKYGRLQTNQLRSETSAGDEIGDLARSISSMLARLHQHNQFLENMPRTLRHEINNPLNTLSTSLQNLENETSEAARTRYLESAKRGVNRIGMIVQNLADAASLEDALEDEEFEVIDLHKLVDSYLSNCRTTHPNRVFEYRGTQREVLSEVSDYRIEQLLDKLIDNAVDFSEPGSTITVGLTCDAGLLTLFVTNNGRTIPEGMLDNIFDSMVSLRASNQDNRLHFGIGLYVVRVIAEHHGGSVSAINLMNGNGVTIRVTLPLYKTAAS
ncbi:MAG: ATP-binding protein [Pseudomonadales bacterium]|jgi:two-component system, OmpR family, sensor histidine kinase ChvG|nr:ATP-binding protein [Pseudomonadales bacterium]MDP4640013.1 ATP-binding protein [Pseudomonadales bacterium]MDP4765363.1 ATP-binding protein [Pseudomonadales bacterium]MDP4874565.1 ATP-binding protein [Pseudomonadales bacterium]MDP4910540.1 ATP-binding protein [Pseudomonadales bacterium]